VVYLYTPLCQLYALLRVSFIALYLHIGICKIVPPKGKLFLVLRLSTSPVTLCEHDVNFILNIVCDMAVVI